MTPQSDIFPPAPRYGYWHLSATCVGLAIYMVHLLGLWTLVQESGFSSIWPVLAMGMILPGLFIAGAVFLLFVPFGRVQVEIGPKGLMLSPVSGRRPRVIGWGDLKKITRRAGYRRPDFLEFRLSDGRARRRITLQEDLFEGTLVDVLRAIGERAPEGGYALKGHLLDIDHWGGEEWRLVPAAKKEKGR